jgi:fatty acid synthase
MLQKVVMDDPVVIHLSAQNYDWLSQAQAVIGKSSKQRILLVSHGEPLNGTLGLVNCIRKEPGGESTRSGFIALLILSQLAMLEKREPTSTQI